MSSIPYARALARISARGSLVSVREAVPGAILSAFILLAFTHLWSSIFDSGEGHLSSWSMSQIAWYLSLARVWWAGRANIAVEYRALIHSGSISTHLLSPMGLLRYFVPMLPTRGIGRALVTFAACAPVAAAYGSWPEWTILFAIVAIPFGWVLEGLVSLAVCAPALAGHDLRAIDAIYTKAIMILGGLFIPLPFAPPVQAIAAFTPFPAFIAAGAEIAVGGRSDGLLLIAAVCLAWFVLALLAARVLTAYFGRRIDYADA